MVQRKYPSRLSLEIQSDVLEFELSEEQPIAVVVMDAYESWIDGVTDKGTNARITKDVGKMRRGLFGDWKETEGIFEMRLDYGPGYRVYYARYRDVVVVLLGGGNKSSQKADLKGARRRWEELRDEIKEV